MHYRVGSKTLPPFGMQGKLRRWLSVEQVAAGASGGLQLTERSRNRQTGIAERVDVVQYNRKRLGSSQHAWDRPPRNVALLSRVRAGGCHVPTLVRPALPATPENITAAMAMEEAQVSVRRRSRWYRRSLGRCRLSPITFLAADRAQVATTVDHHRLAFSAVRQRAGLSRNAD